MIEPADQQKLAELLTFALKAGASGAKRISPRSIVVQESLAELCREPRCPFYGQAMSCPPHVAGPGWLKEKLASCGHAVVFRLEVPASSLNGEERPMVMRLLQEIAAEIETEAIRLGFAEAYGLAGGSCKPGFCGEYPSCRVVAGEGPCRHPRHARPSMSGFGINVGDLMRAAGWPSDLFVPNPGDKADALSWVAGLVLLG